MQIYFFYLLSAFDLLLNFDMSLALAFTSLPVFNQNHHNVLSPCNTGNKANLLLISVCPLTANVLAEGRAISLGLLK